MSDGNPKPAPATSGDTELNPELPTVKVDSTASALDAAGNSSTPAANEGEIEKLQELLFGNQLRAINQKIMLVHKDFKQAISDLERKLDGQIQTETGTLKNIYETASVQMLSSSNDAHDKISILEQAQAGVQVNIEERLTTLSSEIDKKLEALGVEMQRQVDTGVKEVQEKVQQDGTYQNALSKLLSGISEQVNALELKTQEPDLQPASFTAPVQQPHPLDSMLDESEEEDIPTLTPSNQPPNSPT